MSIDPEKDYYGTLGVTPAAELPVIKAAYKALAGIYHPDRNPAKEAAGKMRAVNEAWDILSDPAIRKQYDEVIGYSTPENNESDGANEDNIKAEVNSESGASKNLDIEIKSLMEERDALWDELDKANTASPDYLPAAWKVYFFMWIPLIALAIYGALTDWEDYPFLGDVFVVCLGFAFFLGIPLAAIDSWYQSDIRRIGRKIDKIDKKIQKFNKSKTA